MKTLKIFLLILFALPVFAQEPDDGQPRDRKAQEKIRRAFIALVTDRLDFSPEEAEKFWPIYNEYSKKRQDLRKQFRDAKQQGADEKTLLDLDLKIKQQELDLERDYSGRLQKVITPQKLIRLRQAEKDFHQILINQLRQRRQMQERQEQMKDRSNQRFRERNN